MQQADVELVHTIAGKGRVGAPIRTPATVPAGVGAGDASCRRYALLAALVAGGARRW